MDTLEMTDAEVYQQLLDELLAHLGPGGLHRFLAYAKAGRGELAAACHPWVTRLEAETIQRGMQARSLRQARGTSLAEAPTNGPSDKVPKPLSAMTDDELHRFGLNLMGKNLGLFGLMVFSRLCTPGTGDYTRDRHKWLDKLERDAVLAQIQQCQETSPSDKKE